MAEGVTVDPWRLSLLLETAKHRFGPSYARWFVVRWVDSVTKGKPLPGDVDEWLKETKGDTE